MQHELRGLCSAGDQDETIASNFGDPALELLPGLASRRRFGRSAPPSQDDWHSDAYETGDCESQVEAAGRDQVACEYRPERLSGTLRGRVRAEPCARLPRWRDVGDACRRNRPED